MVVEVPKEAKTEYEGLTIGIKRDGSRLSVYLRGKSGEKEISVETGRHIYTYTASSFANEVNEKLLEKYDMILPKNKVEPKISELLEKLKLR